MAELLSASLVNMKQVSLTGLRSKFKIVNEGDMQECGGQEFIRLHARSHSLMSVIVENNPRVHEVSQPEAIAFHRCNGIVQLMKLRNELQAESFMESLSAAKCSLFAPQAKRQRVVNSRSAQEELRRNPQHLTISITVAGHALGIDVLRSVHPKDNLFVAYDARMLAHVLCFIRDAGFDGAVAERPELPKGVHRRGDGYQVRYVKPLARTSTGGPTYGYRKCASLDDAVAYLNENPLGDHEHDEVVDAKEEGAVNDEVPACKDDVMSDDE